MIHRNKLLIGLFLCLICFIIFQKYRNISTDSIEGDEISEVDIWLQEHNLSEYKALFKDHGVFTLVRCAQMSHLPNMPADDRARLLKASSLLRERLIMREWLMGHNLEYLYTSLLENDIRSLDDVQSFDELKVSNKIIDDSGRWNWARQSLPNSKEELLHIKNVLWMKVKTERQTRTWDWEGVMVLTLTIGGIVSWAVVDESYLTAKAKSSLLNFVTGKYHHPSCQVIFDWEEPKRVGETVTFTALFFQRNGYPYPICNADNILIEVAEGDHGIATICEFGGSDPNLANVAKVKFTARRSGLYKISIQFEGHEIRGSPFFKNFLPGPADPKKTQLVKHSSIIVATVRQSYGLSIDPRDEFNNACFYRLASDATEGYDVVIRKPNSNDLVSYKTYMSYNTLNKKIDIDIKFFDEGCYRATISLNGVTLPNGDFDIIVLSRDDASLVEKNVICKNHELCYEARLISIDGDVLQKAKKVFCYISPKQLIIKEFILKIIPKRVFTFRLCPSTKFIFHGDNNQLAWPTFTIDDGCQLNIEMASIHRSLIAATFTHYLMKNIGGSETFKDKLDFFYHEVRRFHEKHHHEKIQIKVSREKILESSIKATKSFSVSDWCRNFEITFQGEQGLDWGGVRREWFGLVCSALFDARNGLFTSFSDDQQALVHPNPKRPPHLKLKHFEFAGKIVGKCLYESALGGSYRQLVRARFARSFLAQIIGLRIHYKYFEQDDPDLYLNKIKYIEEHDVDEMDLYFVEEEYSGGRRSAKTVDLIPNGSKVRVTNNTKQRYLDCLAQYKLVTSVKTEVEHFLKGLNELIPDSLLSMFDENELELVLCGTDDYDITDFKTNHIVNGSSPEFLRVLEWFWVAVGNFTVEDMARLIQFTTGCAQLPPGGFQELSPKFTITPTPTFGNLPTAHTCFNQLCLPDYDTYEQFEKALLLAIKEGSEGFGFV